MVAEGETVRLAFFPPFFSVLVGQTNEPPKQDGAIAGCDFGAYRRRKIHTTYNSNSTRRYTDTVRHHSPTFVVSNDTHPRRTSQAKRDSFVPFLA